MDENNRQNSNNNGYPDTNQYNTDNEFEDFLLMSTGHQPDQRPHEQQTTDLYGGMNIHNQQNPYTDIGGSINPNDTSVMNQGDFTSDSGFPPQFQQPVAPPPPPQQAPPPPGMQEFPQVQFDNDMSTSGSFLLPNPPLDTSGNAMFRHQRSNSNHSEVSSIAQSPLSASPSPYHSAFSSPYLSPQVPPGGNTNTNNDNLLRSGDVSNLEQLTSNFSLLDEASPAANNHHLDATTNNNYSSSPGTSPTPEISVDYAPEGGNNHANNTNQQNSNIPIPVKIEHNDSPIPFDTPNNNTANVKIEPSTTDDVYLPTTTARNNNNRQRSQSDSDLKQPPPPQQQYPYDQQYQYQQQPQPQPQQQYSNFLSPESAAQQTSSSGSNNTRRSRSASTSSSSASRNRSRSRSASRDYILELAAPTQSNKRVQKHPSAFACTLCDKRFTRAYNLRSHLRTHTDERPFVCTVCGKAFARQHDRKRHEALHSGEKKFECRGVLGDGKTPWGCGRKFARADALGRHFRTEAGRECIRPLLEEEEKEKGKQRQLSGKSQDQQYLGFQQGNNSNEVPIYVSGGEGTPSLMLSPPNGDNNSSSNSPASSTGNSNHNHSIFPSVLLQQFPSLGNLDNLSGSDASDLDEGQ